MQVNQYGNNIVGGIVGANNTSFSPSIQNCYFLNTSAEKITAYGNTGTNCKSMAEEEMKNEDFINLLKENANENIWKKDIENVNDGYPIFNK